MSDQVERKWALHEAFWRGEGPSLILIPPAMQELYDLNDYAARFHDPRAIDLGNPEMYDTRWLLEQCAQTSTVLYSRLAAEPDESWLTYVRRMGTLVRETGVRVILRPMVFPTGRDECQAMLDTWHESTCV